MTKRMLINALYPEECRIAIADNDRLLELEVERADHTQLKGNIYKAQITRIEPSLQAAFLDIGSNRNGFLQINDIHPSYFNNWPAENSSSNYRPSIQEVLRPGQELVVQVVKDQRAAKGATLTTNLSIPGRFLVLMIGSQKGGVSRKIVDEGQRVKLKQAIRNLSLPAGTGVIVRTAGINKSSGELQRDLEGLLDIWYELLEKSFEQGSPRLLYQESDLAIRTIRDYLTPSIEEILIDEKGCYERTLKFVERSIPNFSSKVKYFDRPQPLFSSFHLDSQIEDTSKPEVILPSGGSIVINITEAIVAIDVNSGRSTGQADVEETAFNTNREAAQAIAQQLRLRDLGGLIVVDFIDMFDRRHKATVERVFKDSVRMDKAKIEMGRISKFGLLELSRQRLKSSLTSQSHTVCPHCDGRGRVKTPESAALEALRKIQSAVFAGGVDEIRVRMAPAAALLLLNNKRQVISQFERECNTTILIYADGRMKPEEYELELKTGKHEDHLHPSVDRELELGRNRAGSQRANQGREQRSSENQRGSREGSSRHQRQQEGRGERRRERGRRGGSGRNRNRRDGGDRGRGPVERTEGSSANPSEQGLEANNREPRPSEQQSTAPNPRPLVVANSETEQS